MDDQGHVSALLFSNDVVDGNESQSCSREFGRSVRGVRVRRIGKDEGEKGEREWDEDDGQDGTELMTRSLGPIPVLDLKTPRDLRRCRCQRMNDEQRNANKRNF